MQAIATLMQFKVLYPFIPFSLHYFPKSYSVILIRIATLQYDLSLNSLFFYSKHQIYFSLCDQQQSSLINFRYCVFSLKENLCQILIQDRFLKKGFCVAILLQNYYVLISNLSLPFLQNFNSIILLSTFIQKNLNQYNNFQ